MKVEWFGEDPVWLIPLERDARRRYGSLLVADYGLAVVTYTLREVEIIGDPQLHEIEVRFHREPPYDTYGQPPEDAPRVYSSPERRRRTHNFPGGARCLWYPWDPPDRRWSADEGLLVLLELTRIHIFCENRWRATGRWPLDEAPHGIPEVA